MKNELLDVVLELSMEQKITAVLLLQAVEFISVEDEEKRKEREERLYELFEELKGEEDGATGKANG